jgi:predicted nucleic acid-binding protein
VAVCYFDASALAKLYLAETGSAWVRSLPGTNQVVISTIVIVEVATALRRRSREGELSPAEARTLFVTLLDDVSRFDVVDASSDLLRTAAARSFDVLSVPLRALDAIHLAAARQSFILSRRAESDGFVVVASDKRLIAAARAAGLRVENPEDHA